MPSYTLAFDFGLTVWDIAARSSEDHSIRYCSFPAMSGMEPFAQLQAAIEHCELPRETVEQIVVTGGQHRAMPDRFRDIPVRKVPEVQAIATGGLFFAGVQEALVVSAGSGTAMVAARRDSTRHVTGTAVGGGTLQGLGQLMLGTSVPQEIDRLALAGDSTAVNITLGEAVGGALGMLPAQAAAVNFGKPARINGSYRKEDVAAGLAALVAQEIGIIAAMAARVEGITPVVVMGRLVDLLSIRQNLQMVADIYQTDIRIPPNPGQGTVTGALQAAGLDR